MNGKKALKVAMDVFNELDKTDDVSMVMAIVLTALDTWMSVRGLPAKEADEVFETIYEIAKKKHSVVGV